MVEREHRSNRRVRSQHADQASEACSDIFETLAALIRARYSPC